MTVLQNIRAGARRERDAEKRASITEDIIRSFGLTDLVKRYPHQLSGGQQQRVALARILVSDPGVLLLDEPFSALDSHLRFRLEQEVREIIRSFGKTVVLVSHDRDEVFRLSDKIAVMHNGAVEVCGEKKEVFARPGTRNAATLTGCKNISPIQKLGQRRVLALNWNMELDTAEDVGDTACVGIRMHDLRPEGGCNSFACQVAEEIENPFSYTVMLKTAGAETAIGWETDKETWQQLRGSFDRICLPPEAIILLKG